MGVVRGYEKPETAKIFKKTVTPALDLGQTMLASFHALSISHSLCVAHEGLIVIFAAQNNWKLIPLPVIRRESKNWWKFQQNCIALDTR